MIKHFEDRCRDLHEAVQSVAGAMAASDNALSERLTEAEKLGKQNEAVSKTTLALVSQEQKHAINEFREVRQALNLLRHDLDLAEEARKAEQEKVRESVYAIYNRELLAELAAKIERDASEMYDDLKRGETYDQERWLEWEKAHDRWESALSVWTQNGQWYAPAVAERTFTIDDRAYAQRWNVKDDQFPDTEDLSRSEAVRRFKKFRIIHTQWQEVRKNVDNGVFQAAFVGLTTKELQRGPRQ
jgi:hypothetical protein